MKNILAFTLYIVCILFIQGTAVSVAGAAEDQFNVNLSVSGAPDTTSPSIPADLSATAVSDTEIHLSWTASTDDVAVTGYRIFRDGFTIATTTGVVYADTGLTASTTYDYAVEAFDYVLNYSGQSATTTATTEAAPVTPSSPSGSSSGSYAQFFITDVQVSPEDRAAVVSFTTNVPSYARVHWGLTPDTEVGSIAALLYSNTHEIKITGLEKGTKYFVRIEATDASGHSAFTLSSLETTGAVPVISPLANPYNFKAKPNQHTIELSWSNPLDERFKDVRLVKSSLFFPRDASDGDVIYEGVAENFTDTHTQLGQTYYYALFARDTDGSYTSGALVQVKITPAGEIAITPTDPFAAIPQANTVDPRIAKLTLRDFDFIQDNKLISQWKGTVPIDGTKNLTIRLAYDRVPEILKTIAITLTDPDDSSKVFPFLLRINSDKTAYEATIGPLGKSAAYTLSLAILDYKNQGMKRLSGNLQAVVFEASEVTDMASQGSLMLAALLLILIISVLTVFSKFRTRKKSGTGTGINTGTISAVIFLVVLIGGLFAIHAHAAHAAINKQINYQGKLTDASNSTVADGTYAMEFKLYTQASGGTALWTETLSGANEVSVTSGLFSVMLGSTTPLTDVDFNQTLYLGVNIENDGEMSPRKILGAVPAAFMAATSTVALSANSLQGLDASQFLRADAQNSTSTSSTFLNIVQTGAGKIAEFFGAASQSVLSILSNGNIGIGTSTPYAKLSVAGETVAEKFTATSTAQASTFPYASTTALTVSGTNGLSLGSLNGPLQAVNGAVSATTSIGITYGGTGITTAPSYGQLLLGNALSGYTLTATSSLGITSSQWTTSGSDIYYNTGNVGIGTTSPTNSLTVLSTTQPQFRLAYDTNNYFTSSVGSLGSAALSFAGASSSLSLSFAQPQSVSTADGLNATTSLLILGATGGDTSYSSIAFGGAGGGLELKGGAGGGATVGGGSARIGGVGGTVNISAGSGGSMNVDDVGPHQNIGGQGGVLTLSGGAGGSASGSGGVANFSGSGGNLQLFGGTGSFGGDVLIAGGYSIGGVNRWGDVYLGATTTSNSQGNVFFGGEKAIFNTSTGYFGIGTTSPYAKLSVAGRGVFDQDVRADYFTASSTTATNTFLGNVMIGNSANSGNLYSNTLLQMSSSTNNFVQAVIQNTSNGGTASSDFIVNNDLSSNSTYYGDFGCNSSGYNNASYTIVGFSDCYLYSSDTSLAIGTASSSVNAALKFHTGGTLAANERMRISSTGLVGIGTTTPTNLLSVGARNPGTASDRKAIEINAGGFANPGAFNTNSNGDKLILFRDSAAAYDGTIGIGPASDFWFKSTGVGNAGSFKWYTGPSVTNTMTLNYDGSLSLPITTATTTISGGIAGANGFAVYQGTGNVNIGGDLNVAGGNITVAAATAGNLVVSGTATSTFGGAITVSGTGTSTFGGGLSIGTTGCFAIANTCIGQPVQGSAVVSYLGSVFMFAEDGAVSDATARYIPAAGGTVTSAADSYNYVITRSGTLRNLYWSADSSTLTGGGTNTLAVMVNGATSTLVSSWSGTQIAGSNTTNTVSVNAGDIVSVRLVTTVGGTSIVEPRASFDFEVTGAFGSHWTALSGAAGGINFASTTNVGISTTSPLAKLTVANHNGGSTPLFMIASSSPSIATTTIFMVNAFGNVGIGSTTPGTLLSLGNTGSNTINISATATSTFGSGINLRTGCFSVNGSCISGAISSGTQGQIGFYNSAGTTLTATSSIFLSQAGNVGIGTTSPLSKLTLTDDSGTLAIIADINSTANLQNSITGMNINLNNNDACTLCYDQTGININSILTDGSTNSGIGITVSGGAGDAYGINISSVSGGTSVSDMSIGLAIGNVGGSTNNFGIYQSNSANKNYFAGNVGINTTAPDFGLHVNSTVGFSNLTSSVGDGSLCLTTAGEVVYNAASDSCLPSLRSTKHDIKTLSLSALDAVNSLNPISFVYNQGNGRTRFGFIAEDTAAVHPELATYNKDGDITGIDDRAVLSVLVKAIQEQQIQIGTLTAAVTNASSTESISLIESLFDQFLTMLESAVAHMQSLFVKEIHIEDTFCVDDVCIDKDQLKALLISAGGADTHSDENTPSHDSMSGQNSSEIHSNTPGEENTNTSTSTSTSTSASTTTESIHIDETHSSDTTTTADVSAGSNTSTSESEIIVEANSDTVEQDSSDDTEQNSSHEVIGEDSANTSVPDDSSVSDPSSSDAPVSTE